MRFCLDKEEITVGKLSERRALCACVGVGGPRSLTWGRERGAGILGHPVVDKEQNSTDTSWGARRELEERCKRYRNKVFSCWISKEVWIPGFYIHSLHPLWVQQEAGGRALKQQQLSMCLFSSVSSKAKNIPLRLFYSPFTTTLQSKRIENLAVPIRKIWVKISS